MLQDFYATVAQACFTLLGLWWVVMQIKYEDWMRDPLHRRASYDISLYFLLPGMMSVVSLLAIEVTTIWRIGFAIAGLLGAAESAVSIATARSYGEKPRWLRIGDWVSLALYLLIAAVAIRTELVDDVGLGLRPLEVEGILVALLIFLGVNLAALMLVAAESRRQRASA